MRIRIHENTLNVYTEEKELINSTTSISYIIYPDKGKLLRNRITGYTTDSYVGVGSYDSITNYEEIEK